MTEAGRILVERTSATVLITLDNPRRRNALTRTMMLEMLDLLAQLNRDPSVAAIVITGADGTFCSGMDIGSLSEESEQTPSAESLAVQLEQAVLDSRHPTIAMIRGYALGAGCQLASACDLRVVAKGSLVGLPPAKMGLVYPPSSIKRMIELVGVSTLKYLLFTAEPMTDAQASQSGWSDVTTTDELLEAEVTRLTEIIAERSALSIQASKEIIAALDDDGHANQLFEDWAQSSKTSGEHKEGLAAFTEKRPPLFPSRQATNRRPDRSTCLLLN